MGQPELFAQRTFAEETELITGGAAGWQAPPEIRLDKVQADGYLVIREPHRLASLTAPWSEARHHDEVLLELKLAGNHLDRMAVERALLRQQARQVQRVEQQDTPSGGEPLWLVASHLPEWLHAEWTPRRVAPGCYRIEPGRSFVWISANELPLRDELIPFLLARSGQALDAFVHWVAPRRSIDWVLAMLQFLPMSTVARDDLYRRIEASGEAADPGVEARRQDLLNFLLRLSPQTRRKLVDEGRQEGQHEGQLIEARAVLRRVLALRKLPLSRDDAARIDACADLATLECWLDRAVTAASARDVFF